MLYLLTATEGYQLLKLPFLIQHYKEHKTEKKEITVLAFLKMHYFNGNPIDDDYEKDMKLPFKSHEGASCTNLTLYIPSFSGLTIFKQEQISANTPNVEYKSTFTSAFSCKIWQPPKNC
jgi:hypothetical protein